MTGVRETEIKYGILGHYAVDGDPNDIAYGLYISLNKNPVLLDIREDSLLEQRKVRALDLCANGSALETALNEFLAANPEFRGRKLASIGLHSDDMKRAEVFWDPEGYTLLIGFEFKADEHSKA